MRSILLILRNIIVVLCGTFLSVQSLCAAEVQCDIPADLEIKVNGRTALAAGETVIFEDAIVNMLTSNSRSSIWVKNKRRTGSYALGFRDFVSGAYVNKASEVESGDFGLKADATIPTLSLNQTKAYDFKFNPKTMGEQTGVFRLRWKDSTKNCYAQFNLKGVGRAANPPVMKFELVGGSALNAGDQADLGIVNIGQSIEKEFKISNTGEAPLDILQNPQVTGSAFVISKTLGDNRVFENGSLTFKVKFTATEEKLSQGSISFKTNDTSSGDGVFTLNIKGARTPRPPRLKVEKIVGTATTEIAHNTEIDLGEIPHSSVTTQELKLSNITEGNLNLSQLPSVSGTGFALGLPSINLQIPEGTSQILKVNLTPVDPVNYSGSVVIKSNSENNSNFTVRFKAKRALRPGQLKVELVSGQAAELQHMAEVGFGTSEVYSSPIQKQVRLTNQGEANLQLEAPVLTNAAFKLAQPLNKAVLQPRETVTINLTFTALVAGDSLGLFSIKTSDARFENQIFKINLKGSGTPPPAAKLKMELAEGSGFKEITSNSEIDFGKILANQSSKKTLKITNTGQGKLGILVPFEKIGNSFSLNTLTENIFLNRNESRTFDLTFNENFPGLYLGSIHLHIGNDPTLTDEKFILWPKGQIDDRSMGTGDQVYYANPLLPTVTREQITTKLRDIGFSDLFPEIMGACYFGVYWEGSNPKWGVTSHKDATVTDFGGHDGKTCICPVGSQAHRYVSSVANNDVDLSMPQYGGTRYAIFCMPKPASDSNNVLNYVTTEILVMMNSKVLPPTIPYEIDLGSALKGNPISGMKLFIKNNSQAALKLANLSVSRGFKLETSKFNKDLAAGEMTEFEVSPDASVVGVKSGKLKIFKQGEKTPVYTLSIGGIIWGDSLSATERASAQISGSPSPSPTPTVRTNFGSEIVRLHSAQTISDYEKLQNRLEFSEAEAALREKLKKSGNVDLANYHTARRRAYVSAGAREQAKAMLEKISKEDGSLLMARMSRAVNETTDDPFGKVRCEMMSMLSSMEYLKLPLRFYAQIALNNAVIDRMPNVNALGRFYLRNCFMGAYLSTNPPLKESLPLVKSFTSRIKDPMEKSIVLDGWLAQYPEILGALVEAQ